MSYAHETCCAHLKIQYCRESLEGLTHDWWECASCKMLFAPQGRASLPQWIPISERLPTREDGDEYGNVLWKSPDGIPYAMKFSHSGGDSAVAWLPLPPYTPPKPRPTDVEIELLNTAVIQCHIDNLDASDEIRGWFANVTARIEREKGK